MWIGKIFFPNRLIAKVRINKQEFERIRIKKR
jgi:hypothetical protein